MCYAGYTRCMDVRDLILKQKEVIRRRTRQVVEMIRPEQWAWRPEKDALAVEEMVRHLWVSEEGVRRVALENNFAYYETRIPKGLRAVLGAVGSLDDERERLERVHAETIAAVAAYPLDKFEEERVHEALGYRRKVYVILMGINEHEIHHRAQLMTYLRMLGTPVPEAIIRR